MGEGEAQRIIALAAAEAQKIQQVGLAQAEAIRSQVDASGGARYQLTRQVAERFAQALATSGVDVVPTGSISGQGAEGGGSVIQALMTMLLADKLDVPVEAAPAPNGRRDSV